jgi:hypothetical protein
MIAMTSTTGAMGTTVCLGDRNFLGSREEHLHALCLAVFLPNNWQNFTGQSF